MSSEWSTSAIELLLDLPTTGPRRVAIEHALRDAIRSGRLPDGSPLPSSRALARDLAVSRGTVVDAYGQLVAEGWLTTRHGSGTSVATGRRVADEPPVRQSIGDDARAEVVPTHDFLPGRPDVSLFPRQAWLRATRRVLASTPDASFSYGDPAGSLELRVALARYLARTRGVLTDPARLIVVAGFAQAIDLVSEVRHLQGAATIAFEAPGYADSVRAAARHGLRPVGVAVDRDGIVVDDLIATAATTVVVTPSHQYPTGATLAPDRRARLLSWASERRCLVVEDDYDGELRYDRQPVGALQGLAPEHVVYIGTTSKSLAPGLRLAWMALPESLVDPVREAKRWADRQSPHLDQLVLAAFIEDGSLDRHLRRMRRLYVERRDVLVSALTRSVPQVRVRGIAAGLHALVEIPTDGPPEADVLTALAAAGVRVAGLHQSAETLPDPGAALPPSLIVGFGTPPAHRFAADVEALVGALQSALSASR